MLLCWVLNLSRFQLASPPSTNTLESFHLKGNFLLISSLAHLLPSYHIVCGGQNILMANERKPNSNWQRWKGGFIYSYSPEKCEKGRASNKTREHTTGDSVVAGILHLSSTSSCVWLHFLLIMLSSLAVLRNQVPESYHMHYYHQGGTHFVLWISSSSEVPGEGEGEGRKTVQGESQTAEQLWGSLGQPSREPCCWRPWRSFIAENAAESLVLGSGRALLLLLCHSLTGAVVSSAQMLLTDPRATCHLNALLVSGFLLKRNWSDTPIWLQTLWCHILHDIATCCFHVFPSPLLSQT